MSTLTSFLQSARYDLGDYGTGLKFDDRELIDYLNRMISVLDSVLSSHNSDLVHGEETEIDFTASQNYIDLTNMNNGQWDHIRSIWFDSDDMLEQISVDQMYYKRKWYSGDADPYYWALEGDRIIFETTVNADTNVLIYYDKKTRPRLESYSVAFTSSSSTVDTTNDFLIPGSDHTFVTGDGPVQISNSGGALPTGLSASTDYYIIYDSSEGPSKYQFATSKANALDGTDVDITATGSGTQTIAFTSSTDLMPYNGRFDEMLREMLVMHAVAKRDGRLGRGSTIYEAVFRKRMTEELIRRGFVKSSYHMDF